MRLEHLLIGVAVFLAVITLGTNIYTDSLTNYDLTPDEDLFANITRGDNQNYVSQIEELEADNVGGDLEVGDTDTESSIYVKGIKQIKETGQSVSNTNKLIANAAKKTGIVPEFIYQLIVRIVIILSIVFVIYMIFRYKPHNN